MQPEPSKTDTATGGDQIELTASEDSPPGEQTLAPTSTEDQSAPIVQAPRPRTEAKMWQRLGFAAVAAVLLITSLLALFNEMIVSPHYKQDPFRNSSTTYGAGPFFEVDGGKVIHDPSSFPDLRILVPDPTRTPSLPVLQLRVLYGNQMTKQQSTLELALWHLNREEEQKAAPLLEEFLRLDESYEDEQAAAGDVLAQVYYNQGLYQKSFDIYEKYLDKYSDKFQLQTSRQRAASCLEKLGQVDRAAALAKQAKALALYPNDRDLYPSPGRVYRDANAYTAMESLYTSARVSAAKGNYADARRYLDIVKTSGLTEPNSETMLRTIMFAPVLSMLEHKTDQAGAEFKEAFKVHDQIEAVKPPGNSPAPIGYNDWEIVCRYYADYLDLQDDHAQASAWRRKADILHEASQVKNFRGSWWRKGPAGKESTGKEQ